MPKLKDGTFMFGNCNNLFSVDADLESVEFGDDMFRRCISLTSYYGKFSSLVDANSMFMDCF